MKIFSIECLGNIQKFNWLAVRKGRIRLVADWNSGNTEWLLHRLDSNVVYLECTGVVDEPNRWLCANTLKRKVFLADKDAAMTGPGGGWKIIPVDSDRFRLKCMNGSGTYCYLDGMTGKGFLMLREEEGVEGRSGTLWKLALREVAKKNPPAPPVKEKRSRWKTVFLLLSIAFIIIVLIAFANGQTLKRFSMKCLGMVLSAEFNDKTKVNEKSNPPSENKSAVIPLDNISDNSPVEYCSSLSELTGEDSTVAIRSGTTEKLFDDKLLLTVTEAVKGRVSGFIYPIRGEKRIFQKLTSGESFCDSGYEIRVLEVLDGEVRLFVRKLGKIEKR